MSGEQEDHDKSFAQYEQPSPVPNDRPAVWDLVIDDMRARDALGRARYGTPLQAGNGRDALRDAYEEALDLAVYLRQAIAERDARQLFKIINSEMIEQLRIIPGTWMGIDET